MIQNEKIVIIGGGFAGARVAQDLEKLGAKNVTLIDRKDYFEVTYATLRNLANPDSGKRARMQYTDFIKGQFHKADVVELQKDRAILSDGNSIEFNTVVIASGSSYKTFPVAKSADALTLNDREVEFEQEHQRLSAANQILIIGGGAVGVELTGEIAEHFPSKSITLADSNARLLSELKPKASKIADARLRSLGVNILYNTRLTNEDAEYKKADIVYRCIGLTPNTAFMKQNFSTVLDQNNRITVDETMRVTGCENIFAIGDCSTIDKAKFGYLADMQGALLAKNIVAKLKNRKEKAYKPLPTMALVPIGREQGVAQMPLIGVTTLSMIINMKQKDMFISRQYKNLGVDG